MQRFARATAAQLDDLLRDASTGGADVVDAEYPPGADPERGPLRFAVPARGGLVVLVDVARYATDDFRLAVLFERGRCLFASVDCFREFCHGALAKAFGVTPEEEPRAAESSPILTAEPVPSVPTERDGQLELTDALVEEVRAARRRRSVTKEKLARRLARQVYGQEPALGRVAAVVSAQLAKRSPAAPGSVMLLGPTGVGKTATIEALPGALAGLGHAKAHVYRLDCAELSEEIQLTRVLGSPPGYVGHSKSTPLLEALARPSSIVLLDEIEKAHRIFHDALLALLDTGRLTAPTGKVVKCPHAIVAMTSNLAIAELAETLRDVPLADNALVQRLCREHLLDAGLRPELVGRIGSFAVYGDLDEDARRGAAVSAIRTLAREYELRLEKIDRVVIAVVLDLAAESGMGARGLRYAARDLLAECMADAAAGATRTCSILAGPPPVLVPAFA